MSLLYIKSSQSILSEMASTRAFDDKCQIQYKVANSAGLLIHTMDPYRYEHCNECRNQFGLITKNNVSKPAGNLIDIESDLLGQTRPMGCDYMYQHPCPTVDDLNKCAPTQINIVGHGGNKPRVVDLTPTHLPECNLAKYTHNPPIVPRPYVPQSCGVRQY